MKTYVVWMDTNEARVYKVAPVPREVKRLARHEIRHHTAVDVERHKDLAKYFSALAGDLRDADEVLLIGPGPAKEKFRRFLEERHAQDLGRRIVGTETVDHPTEAEMLAQSRRFFRAYDLFQAV
jgi:stalled ribosome rescue protein Dom34